METAVGEDGGGGWGWEWERKGREKGGLHFMAYILSKSQCVTVALKSMQCIALPIHLIIQHSKE